MEDSEDKEFGNDEVDNFAEENNVFSLKISAKENYGSEAIFHIISYRLGELYFNFPPKKHFYDSDEEVDEKLGEKKQLK